MAEDLSKIDVAILCGGSGNRLRSAIGESQKVMAKMGESPFLDFLLNDLIDQGFKRFILMTGYKAEAVEEYYRRKKSGAQFEFSRETQPLGTGGALKNAGRLIQSDPFICMNGDSFCSLNYKDLIRFFCSKNSPGAIAVSKIDDKKDYGTIILDDSRRIVGFKEKIKDPSATGNALYANAGVYCLSRGIFKFMPDAKKFSLETDFFPALTKEKIFGFETKGNFLDIGTPERFQKARQSILKKR